MPPIVALWAKLGSETWPEKYHPLLCHLIDVAAATTRLWTDVLREPIRKRLATALGPPVEACGRWVALWIGEYDIGNVRAGFHTCGGSTRESAVGLTAASMN
jgi:CRISPR-associated endonuclease/helicase Cas3